METQKLTAAQLNSTLPYLFGNELTYFHVLGRSLPRGAMVVMLGVGPAIMALALLEGAREEITVYGVDVEESTGLTHLNAAGYGDDFYFMLSSSVDAAKCFNDEAVDVLLVDACHTRDCVIDDIRAWYPKVKRGGVVFFHDYEPQEHDLPNNGVRQAVESYRLRFAKEIARPGCSIVFRK